MPPLFSSRQTDIFRDRAEAGARLADALRPRLEAFEPDDIVAIGLARGGVIVAAEVAQELDVRLEAIVVRKLGAPDQPELAIGALAADGTKVLNNHLVKDLGLSPPAVEQIIDQATDAARKLSAELGAAPEIPEIEGKTAILVDDGMATGATMRVAIKSVYDQGARLVIVALPVAPESAESDLHQIADDVLILLAPTQLRAVGQWYQVFHGTPSAEVRKALESNPRSSVD